MISSSQNRGINLFGVNTCAERETTPGYKDNTVKCACSREVAHEVVDGLRKVGVINVNIGKLQLEIFSVGSITSI